MARPAPGAWDFIEVGKEYQYKEDGFIATCLILENNSDEEIYRYKVQIMESNWDVKERVFEVTHTKMTGAYNGMSQFYENPEYVMLPPGTPWPYNYRSVETQKEE